MAQLQITSPRDGDYLNRHDGRFEGNTLLVPVTGTCPQGAVVSVNGAPAVVTGETFIAEAPVTKQDWTITASCGADEQHEIAIMAGFNSRKRYRYSIDDNIEFLHDLGTNPDAYNSLFDHWYLKFWKLMHDTYGTKVHINTYYELSDHSWNTSLMPDKWRGEWEANSDWLHLSFHAIQNLPGRLYQDADYDRMAQDYELVVEQIKRYAGEAVLNQETTVHWAEAPLDACRALKDRGIDTLIGLFWVRDGQCTTKYYLDLEQAEYCNTREAWQDTKEGLTFVTCDSVVNGLRADEVLPMLETQTGNPHTGEMIELLIHEQYFRQDQLIVELDGKRSNYFQSDVFQKVEDGIRWLAEQGYEPCFWSDGLLGSPQ
jgi:hypothetical protein